MAPARVFGAFAGRMLMAAAAKGATKKAAASAGAASTTVVKKTAVKKTVTSKSTGGIQKVVPVTSELGNFIGAPEVSRTEAVKKVWEYIKLQNLQVLFSFSLNASIFTLRSSILFFHFSFEINFDTE